MPDYQLCTVTQLQALLAQSKGAKIVTITALTRPEMHRNFVGENNKKVENPYYNKIRKISKINGIVNWHYANAVNRQREREGKELDFIPSPRLWGTRLNNSPFVAHVSKEGRNKLYLEVKIERVLSTEYRLENGNLIEEETISKWLKKKKNNNKEHQGLEKEIILKDYDVDNIATIVIDGEAYFIPKEF